MAALLALAASTVVRLATGSPVAPEAPFNLPFPPLWPNLAAPPPCTIEGLAPVISGIGSGVLGGATANVTRAELVTGGSFGEGFDDDRGFPQNATNLPEVCAVIVQVKNTTAVPESNYRFGLFLPASTAWNGRFMAVGNGGFNGGIDWPEMGEGPHYGFATASTDTGHNSNDAVDGLVWALNHPDRVFDFGYRAVRGSVAVAKSFVRGYYNPPDTGRMWSYWAGCSTGGRQGLKAVQDDPESFDGALVGAAAWDTRHLLPWIAKISKDNLRPDGNTLVLNASDFSLMLTLAAQVQFRCDLADGIADGIVSAPERCALNTTVFTCPPGTPPGPGTGCLTAEQLEVARKVWADYFVPNGQGGQRLANNGFELGSELQWYITLGGTVENPAPRDFAPQFMRYFVYNDTTWLTLQYTDQATLDSERINPGQATADKYDISAFRDRGGKLLMYHGLADGLVPSRSSALYYNRTLEAMGGRARVDTFYRHFQVPGMQHCAFTPGTVNAPWMFAGAGQAAFLQLLDPSLTTPDVKAGWGTPGFRGDIEYDALLKLMAWTEQGTAPASINAVAYNANWTVFRTRKLCPYPMRANLTGADQNNASSWTCVDG